MMLCLVVEFHSTLIILPEWKPTEGATTYDNTSGISLISASQRRNSPSTVDSKIHHNNLINNILPKIQANLAGCADAIMLDVDGAFVCRLFSFLSLVCSPSFVAVLKRSCFI